VGYAGAGGGGDAAAETDVFAAVQSSHEGRRVESAVQHDGQCG